jgi:hypothetical protein
MASSSRKSTRALSEGCGDDVRPPPTEIPRRCEVEEAGDRALPPKFSEDKLLVNLGVAPPSDRSGGIVCAREGLDAFLIVSRSKSDRLSPKLAAKTTEE